MFAGSQETDLQQGSHSPRSLYESCVGSALDSREKGSTVDSGRNESELGDTRMKSEAGGIGWG